LLLVSVERIRVDPLVEHDHVVTRIEDGISHPDISDADLGADALGYVI
jgi:hypothetical protein